MENMVIRLMQDRDVREVGHLWYLLSLHHENFTPYYRVRENSERLLIEHVRGLPGRGCIIFVCEIDSAICGFVSGYVIKRNPHLAIETIGRVDNIFVDEAYRGKKIGSSLIERLQEYFKSDGIRHIEISCDLQNPMALKLYKRMGFVEQKVQLVKEM